MTDEQLMDAAIAVREQAYSRYSGYRVGAALLDDRGRTHVGCNVENASYPEGSCAETGAIGAMVAAGGSRIVSIAVVGGRDAPGDCTPCGGCRQRIAEFADESTRVIVSTEEGGWQSYTIGELLPETFVLE